jgi:hypothetical protein
MIVQQPITAQQKAEMKTLAKQCKAKVSFSGPHIALTTKCFSGRYPNNMDGYSAALAILEKLTPKQS